MRAEAISGGACTAPLALGDEQHAATARAALNTGALASGHLPRLIEGSRQHVQTVKPERPSAQRPAAMASIANAMTALPSMPAACTAERQPVARTAAADVGDHTTTRRCGEDDYGAPLSAAAQGVPGDRAGDPPSCKRRTGNPLDTGSLRHRATRAVKDIAAEVHARLDHQAPSPADDVPAPSAEAATAVGSPGIRSPTSTAAAVSAAAGIAAGLTTGPEPESATALSPSREPQKRARKCNFCAIHGLVSAASWAHTRDCYFATQCFCYHCARLGFRNRAHGEARTRRLAARAAQASVPAASVD